jgi:threonine/homoserine/homoserine lactone efflux protein
MFSLYIILCIASGVVAIASFFLYVRARMANRLAQERRWRSVHYISLFLFVFFGVLILIHLSDSISRGTSYS